MDAQHSSPSVTARRLARVYSAMLQAGDVQAARESIADAFSVLVRCDQVVVYDADERQDTLVPTVRRGRRGDGPGTCHSLPLVVRDAVRGVVELVRDAGTPPFTDEEIELATALAEAAAHTLESAGTRQLLELLSQTDALTGLYNHRHFYDRLEGELARARRSAQPVALIALDIDDFKRVNDVYGHGAGDAVLVGVARVLRSAVRVSDVVCRVGGDELAVIMPDCDGAGALAFAARLTDQLRATPFPDAGIVTVSVGIATGPLHATSPRSLFRSADGALRTAKARGKDRAVLFEGDAAVELPGAGSRELRSLSHMKMLQSLALRLNALRDPDEIGAAIVDELRGLLHYHSCRVYVSEEGRLALAAAGSAGCPRCDIAAEELGASDGGEAVAGAVATRRSRLLVRDGRCCDGAESIAVVPFTHGFDALGAVEIVKLGDASLDADDVRLLEVLAGHASVALVNAHLYGELRREAEHARALVRFGDRLSAAGTLDDLLDRTVEGIAAETHARRASLWLPPHPAAPAELCATWGYGHHGLDPAADPELATTAGVVADTGPTLDPVEPLPVGLCAAGGTGLRATLALAPLALGDGRVGVIALVVSDAGLAAGQLRLLSGLAGSARLALAKAIELDELRRTRHAA